MGTSCSSAAPKDCYCQDWSLAESGTGLVTNLPQWCCLEGLEGKYHPVLQLIVQLQQHQWLWQGTHPRQSRDRHTTDPAQLLLQLQLETSRVEAGTPSWLEGPSFSSHPTTPTAHSALV